MARRIHTFDHVAELAAKAMANGATRTGSVTYSWDISFGCHDSYTTTMVGRKRDKTASLYLDIHTPCRRCSYCLRRRANGWRYRAQNEIAFAARTWFATFTLSPENQFRCMLDAKKLCRKGGTLWTQLSDDEMFTFRCKAISPEITKYFKRLRKNTNAKLRYCLVSEKHKSGDPHFHALIHEVDAGLPVTYRELTQNWGLGFSTFKLVEDKRAAFYVSKYLSKSLLSRVRASQGYGKF